jgi:hypothetical protein
MKPSILSSMLQHSFPSKIHKLCLNALMPVLDHSQFLRFFKKAWITMELVVHHSSFIRYFHQSHCFLDLFFQQSLVLNSIKSLFFKIVVFLTDTIKDAFMNSFFHNKGQSISKDISKYSIRPFAFVFFAYFSISATMRMMFGQGLNRSEVLFIFMTLVFLWLLSHTRIPLHYFSKKSVLLSFFKDMVS